MSAKADKTGSCSFCGQTKIIQVPKEWEQGQINEAVTCECECEQAQAYAKAKERKDKAKKRVNELFGGGAEKPVAEDVVNLLIATVDAIEDKHMKGITVDVGHDVKAKVSKMAKESIKVERSENKKTKVYFLAPKLDQADLVYDAFYQIVQSDDELDSITKKRRSDIYIKAFNTSVKKIAFNSKKSDGFNPQLVVNDEMEAWPGDQGLKQYEVMTSALGARKQPLIISIATAGYVNDGIFDELFKRATAFLKGNSREKRLLPFIYMIDDIEKWDSIEELKKSNPNLGVSVSVEYYLEQIEIARNSISKKVEFMTKFCNIKQNSAVAWLDYWDVMKCVHEEKPLSLEDFKGCYCVGGIDLSRTTDLTAASIVINRDGINHIFTRFYMPQKRYEVAINEDNTPYNIYRDRGFLFISGENQVDYKDVYNWFIELVKVYKIKPLKIGYDRYSANYLVEDLKTAGFHTDDVYQGTNLTPILHEFEGNLKDGLFDFGDNSMLAAHFLNVAVDINLNDSRMKPVKIEKRMRIDGAMSVFDALTMVSKYHNEIGKKLLNISKETA